MRYDVLVETVTNNAPAETRDALARFSIDNGNSDIGYA
jgi:hypothetical protein